jgi:hypothetical protein
MALLNVISTPVVTAPSHINAGKHTSCQEAKEKLHLVLSKGHPSMALALNQRLASSGITRITGHNCSRKMARLGGLQ